MNSHQIKTLERITSSIQLRHIDGAALFTVEPLASGRILMTASNSWSELKWFEKHQSCFVVIGLRGGVIRKSGNISI